MNIVKKITINILSLAMLVLIVPSVIAGDDDSSTFDCIMNYYNRRTQTPVTNYSSDEDAVRPASYRAPGVYGLYQMRQQQAREVEAETRQATVDTDCVETSHAKKFPRKFAKYFIGGLIMYYVGYKLCKNVIIPKTKKAMSYVANKVWINKVCSSGA